MRCSKGLLVLKDRESMLKINQELKIVLLPDDEHESTRPSAVHQYTCYIYRTPQVLQPLDETGRSTVSDDPIQQRLQRLTASQHQWVDHVIHVDTKVEQLRHEFRQAMVDSALTLQGVMQEVQGQGQEMERIRHTLFNIAMQKLDGLDAHCRKYDEFMQQVLAKTDRQGHEVCTAVEVINEQGDIRNTVEELARRIQRRDPFQR